MKRRTSFYFYCVGTPQAHKHVMRMIVVFSLKTGSGQRAQSMDSDHSGSMLFVKVSAPYTHNPESGTGQTRSRADHRRSRICSQGLRQQILDFFVQPKIFRALRSTCCTSTDSWKKNTQHNYFFPPRYIHPPKKTAPSLPPPPKKRLPLCRPLKKAHQHPDMLPPLRLIWSRFIPRIKCNFTSLQTV